MRTKKTVTVDVVERLGVLVDELKANASSSSLVADISTVRRLREAAREIANIADSVGRLELVSFDETWPATMADRDAKNNVLPIFLGLAPTGEKVVVDLSSLPNLLVGGASGQGKSNLLNAIVCGLARLLPPETLRLVLVDVNGVEFVPYHNLPHLLSPVVDDGEHCVFLLRWLVAEMEKRLKMFARAACWNIKNDNDGVETGMPQGPLFDVFSEGEKPAEADNPRTPLPYIVAVIDGNSKLMQDFGEDFTVLVERLTAKARAAGIHLVLSVENEEAETLPASLRECFPCRIAFRMNGRFESIHLIGSPDATALCAPGDALVRMKDGSLVRVQCAYASDLKVREIVEEAERLYPQTTHCVGSADAVSMERAADVRQDDNNEEMYERALEVVSRTKIASTSHFQRQLGIGYNHAARIIDMMEARGVVGPARGTGPREIFTQ